MFGYVVLHYKNDYDTFQCISSIIKYTKTSPIVVVDNFSNNGSIEKLINHFSTNKFVYFLLLKENLGFAKGNNQGINFLKKHFNPKFIVVLNNDTRLLNSNFEKIISKDYEQYKFDILGPQIINENGSTSSNPVNYIVDTKSKVVKLLLRRYIKLFLCILHLDFFVNETGTNDNKKPFVNIVKKNVKLHGACIIFSKKFFERLAGFYPNTFLYFEEDILYIQILRNHMISIYDPQLCIFHSEDGSLKKIATNKREKNIFVFKNEIRSLKILYKLL